jgi:DNA-binding transcriptional MerR regulator
LTLELTPDCILSMGVTKAVRHTVRIGQVARETGLSIDTIRFYEKQGLLKHSGRTEGGFRVFGPDQIRALRFVRKAQELGFSLGEIRELLILQADEVPACCHVKELLVHKLAGVQQKIQELRSLEHGLKTALRKCERDLEASGPRQEKRCPVLEEIGRAARE